MRHGSNIVVGCLPCCEKIKHTQIKRGDGDQRKTCLNSGFSLNTKLSSYNCRIVHLSVYHNLCNLNEPLPVAGAAARCALATGFVG